MTTLAIGSWIAGHQVPRDTDGITNQAIKSAINGILAWQRPSTAGGGIAPEGVVHGTMPTAYAGQDMTLSACWAIGPNPATNLAPGVFWRRFPSGSTVTGWSGPHGLPLGAETRAQPAYSVQYVTFSLPGATIGAVANETFALSYGMSVTDGVSGIEVYYLSLQLWVP